MDSKIPISPKKSIKALHFKESNKWKDVVQNLEKYIEAVRLQFSKKKLSLIEISS